MNDVDVSKIRPGDVVGFTVLELDSDGDMRVGVMGPRVYDDAWISASSIVSHTPAPRPALKVGDRVVSPWGTVSERTVALIDDAFVYLAPITKGDSLVSRPLSEVETWERV